MVAFLPILIKVGSAALQKGAATAIAKWAGGNAVKSYIAQTVAKKAIDEARKFSLGESKDWQAAFKKDPGEALRDAAKDWAASEVRDYFGKKPQVNEKLVKRYEDDLMGGIGEQLNTEVNREIVSKPENLIVNFDPDKLIDRSVNNIIESGLKWSEEKDVVDDRPDSNILNRSVIGGSSQLLNRSVIGGSSQLLSRSVIGGSSQLLSRSVIGGQSQIESSSIIEQKSQIETKDLLESAGKTAFYDSFDPEALVGTVIGPDDALRGKLLSPLEALTKQIFDVEVRGV